MRDTEGARTGGAEPEGPELASLRRQLEGGLEVLEACSARYRELSEALQRRNWKARLREAPGLLRNALHAEASLPEVLTRLQRRAGQETGGQGPASRWLRELEAERAELSRRIARRLSVRTEAPLTERLGRLEAVALAPLPLPPSEGEIRLLEGGARWPPFLHGALWYVSWRIAAQLVGNWVGAPLFLLFYLWFYLRSGHYWLTSERLLWKPRLGEPVQVLLSSLEDGQVSEGFSRTVKLRGRSRMTMRHVPHASKLAALLCIHRRREFRDVARGEPTPLMAILEMYRTAPGETPDTEAVSSGLGVIRPGFVVYFPPTLRAKLLDVITEPMGSSGGPAWRSRDTVTVPVPLILEQLQLLPEERIDALLRKALHADPDILLWEPGELTWRFGNALSMEVVRGEKALWAPVPSWVAHQHVGRILDRWRRE